MQSATHKRIVGATAGLRWHAAFVAFCVLLMGVSAGAQASQACRNIPTTITIDVPQALQTQPVAINNAGAIVGGYVARNGSVHAFLRSPNGSFTTVDPPGAALAFAWSISPGGAITGVFGRSASDSYHGFLRNPDGTYATFDAPGAGTSPGQGTAGYDVNVADEVAGDVIDSNGVYRSYLRAADGTFTVFDAPGAGTAPGQGTEVATVDGLNSMGVVVGAYSDAANVYHGFLRASDGSVVEFDVPGAGTGPGQGTQEGGINQAGTTEGFYTDAVGTYHSFLRSSTGTIIPYDAPGAGTGAGQGTLAANINAQGEIAGAYIDFNNVVHGFVREPDGTITEFDAPGAGTQPGQGTEPFGNNASGEVTGWYTDDSGLLHGFLRSCR